jgi:translocation and assembly module TamB
MKLRKMNKILAIFFLVVTVLSGAVWNYLSSEQFAKIINQQIFNHTKDLQSLQFSFKQIQPTIIPPGISIGKVDVEYKLPDEEILSLSVDSIDVAFNLFDFLSKKVSINWVKVKNGHLEYKTKINQDKMDTKKFFDEISKGSNDLLRVFSTLPIKIDGINLDSVNIKVNEERFAINKLEVAIEKKSINSDFEIDFLSGLLSEKVNYLHGSVVVNKDFIKLSNIRAYGGNRNTLFNGQYEINSKNYLGYGRIETKIKNLQDELNFADIGKIYDGTADVIYSIEGNLEKFKISSEVVCENVKSDFINVDKISGKLEFENNKSFKISNVVAMQGQGKLEIGNEFTIYDFGLKEFIPGQVNIKVNKFEIKNILSYVQDSLSPLNAKLTGELRFALNRSGFSVEILEEVLLNDVDVIFGKSSAIKTNHATLSKSLFELNHKTFYMNSSLLIDDGRIAFEGKIDSNSLAIIVSAEKIVLERFDNFSFLKMKGLANFNIAFTGSPENTEMDATFKFSNYTLENFYLGEGRAHILFNFKSMQMQLPTLVGKVGVSNYSASANLDLDKMIINSSNIQFRDSSYSDVLLFHTPLASTLNRYKNDVIGLMNIKYSVTGPFDVQKLVVEGSVNSDGINIYGEYLNSLKLSFDFKDYVFQTKSIQIKKDNSYANAQLIYDLNKDLFSLNVNGGPFQLQRLSLYLKTPAKIESDFKFDVKYKSVHDVVDFKAEIELLNSKYETRYLADSKINISYGQGKIIGDINLFDDYLLSCNVDLDGGSRSKCGLTIDTDKLETVLGGVLGANIRQQDFDGSIDLSGDFSFIYPNWSTLTTSLKLKKLMIRREDVSFVIDKMVLFNINNGKISKLKETFIGNNAMVGFHFSGDLSSTYDFGVKANFKSSILSLVSPKILKSSGVMTVDAFLENQQSKLVPRINISSEDLELSVESIPFNIKRASIDSFFQNGVFQIKKFHAELDSGKLFANGSVALEFPYPNLSLNFQLEQAKINLFEFADTIFSGKGTLTGSQLPYYLSGDVLLNRATVRSLPDSVSKAATNININPYLPKANELNLNSLLRLNMALKTQTPVNFINNLMDMGLNADLLLQGPVTAPRAQGIVQIVPKKSKVYFKNSEYVIVRGDLLFNFERPIENPELDVLAQTNINNYLVKVRTFGPFESMNFDFASEPPLSQQDILSLVAFGYTDDVSQRLSDVDRQNLSSIGVGQFLFGQLQINQRLKQSLGVELNLGTQFEMQSSSLLNARTSDGDSTGRVRSATRIQLKKQLSEEMELSVSSTLGGSIGQRQSMNLNYSINKNTSLEGIYEVKNNDEGEEDIIDKSVGADVKFKWSF